MAYVLAERESASVLLQTAEKCVSLLNVSRMFACEYVTINVTRITHSQITNKVLSL
jgi:hypothetical protein